MIAFKGSDFDFLKRTQNFINFYFLNLFRLGVKEDCGFF